MKKLVLLISALLMTSSAFAGTKIVWVTANTQEELSVKVDQMVAKIDKGRLSGCENSKVYAVDFKNTSGSYVKDAHGNFRPVKPKAAIKVKCANGSKHKNNSHHESNGGSNHGNNDDNF